MRAVLATMLAISASSGVAAQTLPTYRVIAEEKSEAGRTVDIRIERRLDEADIGAIANAIVGKETKPYARTTVNFILPAARPGEPPWANATLVREIRVKIPGLRLDEERMFVAEAHGDRRDVIGSWLTSTPATPGRLTLYREGRKLFAEWRMRTGVKTQDEVTETRVSAGRRFDLKSGASEDHFLMLPNGDLEIRAKGTLIASAERIRETPGSAATVAGTRAPQHAAEAWPPARSASGFTETAATTPAAETIAPVTVEPPKPGKSAGSGQKSAAPRRHAAPASSPKIDLSVYLNPPT